MTAGVTTLARPGMAQLDSARPAAAELAQSAASSLRSIVSGRGELRPFPGDGGQPLPHRHLDVTSAGRLTMPARG
jgi:hypothetical protein